MHVGAFQGPGIAATNIQLRPDPDTPTALALGYNWPAAGPVSSGSSSRSVAVKAGVAASLGFLGLVALGVGVILVRLHLQRKRHGSMPPGLPSKSKGKGSGRHTNWVQQFGQGLWGAAAWEQHCQQPQPPQQGAGQASSVSAVHAHARGDGTADASQGCNEPNAAAAGGGGALDAPAAAAVLSCGSGDGTTGTQLGVAACSRNSKDSPDTAAPGVSEAAAGAGAGRDRQVLPVAAAPGVAAPSAAAAPQSSPAPRPTLEETIAQSLQHWNAAVSHTTLQLMQQRMQRNNLRVTGRAAAGGTSTIHTPSSTLSTHHEQLQQQDGDMTCSHTATAAAAGLAVTAAAVGALGRGGVAAGDQGLQLHHVIGTGSYGCVYLGSWRGKRVAVKVMHLQNSALMASEGSPWQQLQQQQQQQQQQGSAAPQGSPNQQQQQRNSPPHMAMMEAVVSSAMSHPSVVQVFTYMLTPLMLQNSCGVHDGTAASQGSPAGGAAAAGVAGGDSAAGAQDVSGGGEIFGWQLRLVMELCDKVSVASLQTAAHTQVLVA